MTYAVNSLLLIAANLFLAGLLLGLAMASEDGVLAVWGCVCLVAAAFNAACVWREHGYA